LRRRRTKRTLARAATVACLLIIGVLALSFEGGELNAGFRQTVGGRTPRANVQARYSGRMSIRTVSYKLI
jgi:hypothetical protein